MIPVPADPERNIRSAAENNLLIHGTHSLLRFREKGCRFYPTAFFEHILKKLTYEIRSEISFVIFAMNSSRVILVDSAVSRLRTVMVLVSTSLAPRTSI